MIAYTLACSNDAWRNCPGSPREKAAYPYEQSTAGVDGKGTHLLLEACIKMGVDACVFVGQTLPHKNLSWNIDVARAARVQLCLDYIKTRKSKLEETHDHVIVESEKKLDVGVRFNTQSKWWGQCDVTITAYKDNQVVFVEVIDYKDGGGFVDVNNNTQLLDYCFANVVDLHFNIPCQITIVQPKLVNNPIRTQDLDRYTVVGHAERMAVKAQATDDLNAPLNYDGTGKGWCRWCPHLSNCEAARTSKVETLNESEYLISEIHGDLSNVSNEMLSKILDAERVYKDAFTRAKVEAEERIGVGEFLPGWYMGVGKVSYKWNMSDEEVHKKLKAQKVKLAEIFPSNLLTPAVARQLPGTPTQIKNREEWIEKVEGKPTLKKGKPQLTPKEVMQS